MQWLLNLASAAVGSPQAISIVCGCYIALYYVLSWLFIHAAKKRTTPKRGLWHHCRRNGPLDRATTSLLVAVAALLIWSLVELCITNRLPLAYLAAYYVFFVFIFAFCYGLAEWHWEGCLSGVKAKTWNAEVQYVLLSVGVQTTLGYHRARPKRTCIELLASVQALLGLFFVAVFVAKAVGFEVTKMTPHCEHVPAARVECTSAGSHEGGPNE